jgi:NADH-quinone oxidoreductase subunit M
MTPTADFLASRGWHFAAAIPALGAACLVAVAALNRARSPHLSGRDVSRSPRRIALLTSTATLGAVIGLALASRLAPSTVAPESASPNSGIPVAVAINGVSLCFVFLVTAAWIPVVASAQADDAKKPEFFYALLLLLEGGYLGIFLVDDVVWFCIFWQSSALAVYLLLSLWGREKRDAAARRYLLMDLTGSLLVLTALLGIVLAASRMAGAMNGTTHPLSFSISGILRDIPRLSAENVSAQEYWNHARRWILTTLILGLMIKGGIVPFHTWLPPVCSEGPNCLNVAILGVGLRISAWAFLRFVIPLSQDFGAGVIWLIGFLVLGTLYSSFLALAHDDLRMRTAYAVLSQLPLAVAGLFSLQVNGSAGAVLFTIGGGLAATILGFASGFLESHHGAPGHSAFHGLRQTLPRAAALLTMTALCFAGAPGLSEFAGLYLILGAIFRASWTIALCAMCAGLMLGWSFFWMIERSVQRQSRLPTFLAETESGPTDAVEPPRDLNRADLLLMTPVFVGICWLGLWPQSIVDCIRAALSNGLRS